MTIALAFYMLLFVWEHLAYTFFISVTVVSSTHKHDPQDRTIQEQTTGRVNTICCSTSYSVFGKGYTSLPAHPTVVQDSMQYRKYEHILSAVSAHYPRFNCKHAIISPAKLYIHIWCALQSKKCSSHCNNRHSPIPSSHDTVDIALHEPLLRPALLPKSCPTMYPTFT